MKYLLLILIVGLLFFVLGLKRSGSRPAAPRRDDAGPRSLTADAASAAAG